MHFLEKEGEKTPLGNRSRKEGLIRSAGGEEKKGAPLLKKKPIWDFSFFFSSRCCKGDGVFQATVIRTGGFKANRGRSFFLENKEEKPSGLARTYRRGGGPSFNGIDISLSPFGFP